MTRTLGWTLLHFLWQGAAVASILACLNLALRRSTPQLRYALACGSLLLMLVLPAATFRTLGVAPAPVPSSTGVLALVADAHAEAAATSPASTLQAVASLGHSIESLLPGLVALWGAGVLLLCLRSFGGMAFVRRLGRSGLSAAPPALEATLARLAHTLGVESMVRLYESALVGVPTVVGWFRPVILLPASAITGLTAHQLELILAHELGHVRRHDYLVNLVQSAAETLLFYHPAVWWVSSRMRVEREHCCDDLAVDACGSAVRYARALVELEGLCSDAPALAVAANGGSLFDRIARLVGRVPEPSRAARGVAAALAVASLALALGIGSILLDRPAPTVVDLMASSQLADTISPEVQPAPAGILESAKAEAPVIEARPETATIEPTPEPQALPAAKAAPAAEPQARAFPLERVLEMARSGITPEYIDAMDALGYASLGSEQLIALRHQGVGPDYVRELAAQGYKNLSAEQLIGLRAQGVSASFVKGLSEQGLKDLSLSSLLALRSQGVTPQYVAELKEAGQTDLSVTSLLSLRSQGVNPDYVRALSELGYQGLQVGQLLELRSQGVTPDYVRELKAAGFDKLTPEELVTLRSQGVSARLLKSLRGRQQP